MANLLNSIIYYLKDAIVKDSNNNVTLPADVFIANDAKIQGRTTGLEEDKDLSLLTMSASNNCVVGYGSYDQEIGHTSVYGGDVRLYSKSYIDLRTASGSTIKKNGRDFIYTRDIAYGYNQTAGTVGTRFLDDTDDISVTGYTPIGAFVLGHGNNYYAICVPYLSGNLLHVDMYRAGTSARDNQTVTIRILYIAN